MSFNHRKCAKCGKTRIQDKSVTYHRFPVPGDKNIQKALAWAKFCWPNKDFKVEELDSFNRSGKMLCGRHFKTTDFYDSKRTKLSLFALPSVIVEEDSIITNKENILEEDFYYGLTMSDKKCCDPGCVNSQGKENANPSLDHNCSRTRHFDHNYCRRETLQENVEDVNMTGSRDNETGSDNAETEDDEIQLINDEEALVPKPIMDVLSKTELTSFRCDACLAVISGVRYHCMQCADVDFCSECEARGNHETHYMLRVPQYKPLAEVRSVLTAVQRALDSALAAAQELITIKNELDLKQEEDSETNCDPLLDPLSEPIFCNTNQENNDHKSVTDFNESNADSDSGEDMIRVYDNSDETNDLFVQSDHSEDRVVLPVKNSYKRKCVETKKTDHCFMGTDDDVIVEMYEEIRDTNLVFTNEDEYNILQLHQALTPISVGEPQKKRTRQS